MASVLALAAGAVGCSPLLEAPTVVRVAYHHDLATIDPHGHNDSLTGAVLGSVFEPLVRLEPGSGVRPWLVQEWTTPDDRTWRVKLRPGVDFHDGRPVQATDVVASLRRARDHVGSGLATYLEIVEEVRLVEGTSDQIEIVTRDPFPLLLTRLGLLAIVPADFDPARPIGTGPLLWTSEPGERPIRLQRWEGYWGRLAAVDEAELHFIEDETVVAERARKGQIDVISAVSGSWFRDRPLGADWTVVRIPSVSTSMLAMPVNVPPFTDPRVRWAIDLAIDREELARRTYGLDSTTPAHQFASPEVFGFGQQPTAERVGTGEVVALLGAAGVGEGAIIRLVHSGVYAPVVKEVARQLALVGLRVEAEAVPYDVFHRELDSSVDRMFIFAWNFRFGDVSDFLESTAHTRVPERLLGLLNGSGYSSADVDRWIEEASREPNASVRLELMRRALERLAEDRPMVPLLHHSRVALVRAPFAVEPGSGSWVAPHEIRLNRP